MVHWNIVLVVRIKWNATAQNMLTSSVRIVHKTENVALDKVTLQDGHNTSVLAVDGVREQNGSTGRCTRAYSTSNVFRVKWYVDLGREYHIKQIKIYFRNDG